RKVGREHAALRSKNLDRVAHYWAISIHCPGLSLSAEAGNLDGNVRTLRSAPHCCAPARQALGTAVGRQAGVIDDDLRLGIGLGQFGRFVKMPPRGLKVEAQTVRGQHGKATSESRVAHRSECASDDIVRACRCGWLVANAADEGRTTMRLE